jgi:CarD family transcriptional regulator
MFAIGDYVIYRDTGVCKISDITKLELSCADKTILYYVLDPVYEKGAIFAPKDSSESRMRHIITKKEAERLIDLIPAIQAKAYHNTALRELADHYRDILKTSDCAELIEMTMSIYAKKLQREEDNAKLGMVDQRYMKQAESFLFGELAVALNIPRESVQEYIEARVQGRNMVRPSLIQ